MRKKRISKVKSPEIAVEAVALFHRAAAMKPVYDRCVRGRCKSPDPATHCRECTKSFQVRKALAHALGLNSIVDASPLNVTSETLPAYIARNEALAPDWRRAWQLRQALIAADGEDTGG